MPEQRVDNSVLSVATTHRITFPDITAPLTPADFLSRHWSREGVLLRVADRDFARFCGWDALNAILDAGDLTFPGVKMSRSDRPVPTDAFTTTIGGRQIVEARNVVNLFREGASFGITGADAHWAPLRQVVDCFRDALLESVHTNVYCSPANTQGFQCHYDLHEVFVLQVSGTKHWRVFRPLTESPVEGWKKEDAEEVVQTEPYIDAVLRAGDVLYVPRGHWHYAVAEDSISLHVTVGITCRKGLDFLEWLSGELSHDEIWRRNAPLLNGAVSAGSLAGPAAAWSSEIRESLAEKMADRTLFERFLRDTIRAIQPLHTVDLLAQGTPDVIALDRVVFERPAGRPFVVEEDASGAVVVSVAGSDIQLDGISAAVIARLFESDSFTLAQVRSWDPFADVDELSELLTALVRSGLLLIRPAK